MPSYPEKTCAIERGEEAVAGGVLLHTAKTSKLVAHESVMVAEQLLPATVAESHRSFGRTDDVREEYRREDAIQLGLAARARQELLQFFCK